MRMLNSKNIVHVGIGQSFVLKRTGILMAIGLGSCVGVGMYDPVEKVGGMVHILLPDSKVGKPTDLPGKFADKGVPHLLDMMIESGAKKERLIVKIAGGASMFKASRSPIMDIGSRNVAAVKKVLKELGLSLHGEAVGGNEGKTFILDVATGKFYVRTVRGGQVEI